MEQGWKAACLRLDGNENIQKCKKGGTSLTGYTLRTKAEWVFAKGGAYFIICLRVSTYIYRIHRTASAPSVNIVTPIMLMAEIQNSTYDE